MANLVGQSVGRYHILEQLGEGGMAVVYKGFDTRLERNVAIKVILSSQEQDEKFLKRFEREARALAQLSHPNIVKVLDYGDYEGVPYLVMEYIPGGILKQKISKPIPWQEAARLLAPIARALEYAHQQKIIHRDIKPANILLTQSGAPMLSDFGIAKLLEREETVSLTGTGVGIGTPDYMAPEQGVGQAVDHRADIYALGIVFYEMVAGRTPYRADTPMAVIVKKVTEPLPRPKQFISDLPDSVERVLLKALAKEPDDRYAEMGSFATALESLAASGGRLEAERTREEQIREEATRIAVEPVVVSRPPVRKKKVWWPWAVGCGGAACLAAVVVLGIVMKQPWFFPTTPSRSTPAPTQVSASVPTAGLTAVPTSSVPTQPQQADWSTRPRDGMEMVYVPEGSFMMGNTVAQAIAECEKYATYTSCDEKDFVSEAPPHTVYLDAFWIDKTEVTTAMYDLCVQAGICKPPANFGSITRSSYYRNAEFADYPVIYVDWNSASTYCQWAGARLPTEAEWEKAARGTEALTYPWGNNWDVRSRPRLNFSDMNDKSQGGSSDSLADDGYADTAPVGTYPAGASPYGALDMAGNVWEWVADWYGADYYSGSPVNNPTGPVLGTTRSARGGSWFSGINGSRSSYRAFWDPAKTSNVIGFRCARAAKP